MESTPEEGKGRRRIRQRVKLSCSVISRESSANPTGRSEDYLGLGSENWVFVLWSLSLGTGQCKKGLWAKPLSSAKGNNPQRGLTPKAVCLLVTLSAGW